MAGLGVPGGFILMYCPGLAHVLLHEHFVHNKEATVGYKGERRGPQLP